MNIPRYVVPEFPMTVPSTGEEITFRPYVVREEKLLILAGESNDTKETMAIVGRLVESCTNGKIDVKTSPLFDVQYAFVQIRSKSVGEKFELVITCSDESCGGHQDFEILANDLKVRKVPGHSKTIVLEGGLTLEMRYPTFEEFNTIFNTKEVDDIYAAIAACVQRVFSEEESLDNTGSNNEEFMELLDNLPPKEFDKVENFFATMPVIEYQTEVECKKCGKKSVVVVDGIHNFFE